ncbi:hypothetical protein NUU61_003724 [Penicillium alfredii]|uniref:Uncharacterized protein n=1 Tax=Penicillium alfredii TaxID=1506179 RepID=A0A9W9FJW3_9EURO|nr:uncharacterized protein NUU61_003724 [Penicillium alfredii]KAJ5101502.1 hypothetical protein NUU61_003724 [Penicillium alfredii]
MASTTCKTSIPASIAPTSTFTQDISRAIMTAAHEKPAKLRANIIDGMPPAPPPSPVSFAVDRKVPGKIDRENIPNLNLE